MEENIIVKLLNDKDLGTSRLLTREEEQEIFSLYAKDKSLREDVQTIMINANQKLVYSIARKYRPFMNASYDDIVQLGRIGLSKAVDKYDLSKILNLQLTQLIGLNKVLIKDYNQLMRT